MIDKVYVVIHTYDNGVEQWHNICAIYADRVEAEFECYVYAENNKDPCISYCVESWAVK